MMEISIDRPSSPKIIQWLLDTRSLWPVPGHLKPKEEVAELRTVVSNLSGFKIALVYKSRPQELLPFFQRLNKRRS
jgi:hypothetical protein